MITRNTITVEVGEIDLDKLCGPIAEAAAYLQGVAAEHPSYRLEAEPDYDGYALLFRETRLETEEEVAARRAEERAAAARARVAAKAASVREVKRQAKRDEIKRLQQELSQL